MPIAQSSALLIVDVQNDLCPGGAVAVAHGDAVVGVINRIAPLFGVVVATQDWHPPDHCSFVSQHPGKKSLDTSECDGIPQVLWPDHCVQGSPGAAFHADLDMGPVNLIVRKGTRARLDSRSGFFEADHTTTTGIDYYLKGMGAINLYVCGLATDYGVYYTAADALQLGYHVHLLTDACRGVGSPEGSIDAAWSSIEKAGAMLISSDHIS